MKYCFVRRQIGEQIEVAVTHGYSKDHRAECKQVLQELLVSPDGDVPFMFTVWSGNTSDSNVVIHDRIVHINSSRIRFPGIFGVPSPFT